MKHALMRLIALLALLMAGGCSRESDSASAEPVASTPPPTDRPVPFIVEVRAVGMKFEAPANIPSGWVTFRFVNASSMLHFAMMDVPPFGIPIEDISQHVMVPFQEAMDAMNAGDEEGVNTAFGKFPAWIGNLGRNGGPGLLSPGRAADTTIFMEPGRYIWECYVKSDGIFHTSPQAPGELGMMLEFNVTEEASEAPEPQSDVQLAITNAGFELSGELQPGRNTIRVDFAEQQAFPSFTGNDVHVMRVDGPDSIAAADAWMDWRTPDGLEDPAPVEFVGGINDMPAGRYGYFTVNLEPGDYAFIAEIPGPKAAGFVLPFTIVTDG